MILIHGLAASLHDWDFLIPELTKAGYASFALDLLGHGESPKPDSRAYQLDWLCDHFFMWVDSLNLTSPAVLVGHSLGGYLALEYARRFPSKTRGLILVDPFYARRQFPPVLRRFYQFPRLIAMPLHHAPTWLLRIMINTTSVLVGHGPGGMHGLPKEVREQSVLDYTRTAEGVYNILSIDFDLTPNLSAITCPSLVVWGERDQTLSPASFSGLAGLLPHAEARHIRASHIVHQTHAEWFNREVLEFLKTI